MHWLNIASNFASVYDIARLIMVQLYNLFYDKARNQESFIFYIQQQSTITVTNSRMAKLTQYKALLGLQ